MTRPILRILSFLLLGCCVSAVSGQEYLSDAIVWEKDINAAVAKAKETNRLVFIHFYGDNCPPCKAMDAEVFTNRQVIADMNRFFVSVRVDTGLNPALVRQFDIKAIPADVVLKSNGQFVHRRQGGIAADRFDVYLNYINNEIQAKNAAVAPKVAAQPVVAVQETAKAVPVQVPVQQPMQVPVNAQTSAGNPWDNLASSVTSAPVQAPMEIPTFSQGQTPPPPTNLLERNNPVRMDAAVAVKPAFGAVPDVPQTEGIVGSTVEIPLALDGFCPVTLSGQERWVPGNPLFYAMYQGQIFRCANEESLATFIKEPAKYAPVAMGEDIVQMVERNKKVPGMRKFGAWFQNRVFLFSNQESLDAFAAKPEFYAEIAQKYETALRTRFDSVQR